MNGLGLKRGFVPRWSPDRLSGLAGWFESDRGVTTVSSKISIWEDVRGNGRTLSQSSDGFRPLLASNEVGNYPGAVFDGTDDILWFSDLSVSAGVAGMTAIMLIRYAKADNETGFFCSTGAGINSTRFAARASSNQYQVAGRRLDSDGAATFQGGTKATGEWQIQSVIVNYSAATASIFVDGAQVASGAFLTAGNTQATASLASSVGAAPLSSNSTQFHLGGAIASLLVLNRAVSSGERQAAETYITRRFL